MDNKRNVTVYDVPDEATVEMTITTTTLKRLKYLFESYLKLHPEKKQLAAMMLISDMSEDILKATSKDEEQIAINIEKYRKAKEKAQKDPFIYNVLTLSSIISSIEYAFHNAGILKEREVEVNFASGDIAAFYDQLKEESKKKD
jgi:hypothetical protein